MNAFPQAGTWACPAFVFPWVKVSFFPFSCFALEELKTSLHFSSTYYSKIYSYISNVQKIQLMQTLSVSKAYIIWFRYRRGPSIQIRALTTFPKSSQTSATLNTVNVIKSISPSCQIPVGVSDLN